MSKERKVFCDVIAGIMIVRMILGHYVSYAGLKDSILFESLNVLYFYMPWFFYKSGMFAKPCDVSVSKTDYLKKEFKRLLVPFLVFTALGFVCSISFGFITNSSGVFRNLIRELVGFIQLGYFYWSSHLWFLLTLFIIKCAYSLYIYKCNKILILIASLCFACLHNLYVAPTGSIWGGNLFSGLIFFVLGNILKNLQYNNLLFVFSIVATVLIGAFCPTFVSMFSNTLQNEGFYLLWYPFCLGAIIVVQNVFYKISDKSILFAIFGQIGVNSMAFYLTHFSIVVLACRLFHYWRPGGNNWHLLCVIIVVSSIILPMLVDLLNRNKIKWMIGK